MRGLQPLNELDKEAVIAELLDYIKEALEKEEPHILKARLIDHRIEEVRARLTKEAGIEMHTGIFGTHVQPKDEDNG